MYMKLRTQRVLKFLLEQYDFVSVRHIADVFQVSVRSIRYDLEDIARVLRDYGAGLEKVPKRGVRLTADTQQRGRILADLAREVPGTEMSEKAKIRFSICYLMAEDRPVTTRELGDKLQVGRSAAARLIDQAEAWLRQYGIGVLRKPNYGVRLTYTEAQWRRAVSELLAREGDTPPAGEAGEGSSLFSDIPVDMQFIFKGVNFPLLTQVVDDIIAESKISLVESSYLALLVHLAMAVRRIRDGKVIQMDPRNLAQLREKPEFARARAVLERYRRQLDIEIGEDEIGYVTLHLLGSKRRDEAVGDEERAETHRVARQILRQVAEALGRPIDDDDRLIADMVLHLNPAIVRMSNGMKIHNPYLEEISAQYPRLFDAVREAMVAVFAPKGLRVPDDEVGYITLHVGALLEQNRRRARDVIRTLLVCGSGVGTVKMLSTRVRTEFPQLKIVAETSAMDLDGMDLGEIDLIITTVGLRKQLHPGIVQVSPLLPGRDRKKIENIIGLHYVLPRQGEAGVDLNGLLSVIGRHCRIEDRAGLEADLGEFFAGRRKSIGEIREANRLMLADALTQDMIEIDFPARDWRDAVEAAGRILVRGGLAEDRYVAAMVENVQEMGPYIVVAKGVAMPHARPGTGARQAGMSMVRLREPVNFGNADNDPVDLVFALSAVDSSSHLDMMADMGKLLSGDGHLDGLRRVGSTAEIVELIKQVTKEETV